MIRATTLILLFCLIVGMVGAPALPRAWAGRDPLVKLEKEFKQAIDRVSAATVTCVAKGAAPGQYGSSGVIVSRKGLVLSDGDPGVVLKRGQKPQYTDEVEIRVPNLRKGGYRAYDARIVRRSKKDDSCLLRIVKPPTSGFQNYLQIGSSDDLKIGAFTFVMGNAFHLSNEGSPSLTAGIVSNLEPRARGAGGGRYEFFYTSAAVNPGVNGGPVVDATGRLVGIVSTWVSARGKDGAKNPRQFLGKIVPIDRLGPIYADLPEASELFPKRKQRGNLAPEAQALESVLYHTAHQVYGSLVSLEITRKKPVSTLVPGPRKPVNTPRYEGPVSAVLVEDGYAITSLYNLTSIVEIMFPQWGRGAPSEARFDTGLADIESMRAIFSDRHAVPAKLVGYHQGLGVALVKLELEPAQAGETGVARKPVAKAPMEAYVAGAFALALGNPFGDQDAADPLLAFGILSKRHADYITDAWRASWQTDAGVTDANCGGAAVDIEGRLFGMLHLWSTTRHGRNSGIGFVVPWPAIATCMPRLKKGQNYRRPFLGVSWKSPTGAPKLKTVVPKSAAEAAGLRVGDLILKLDGTQMKSVKDCTQILSRKWSGDSLRVQVLRDGAALDIDVVLGGR